MLGYLLAVVAIGVLVVFSVIVWLRRERHPQKPGQRESGQRLVMPGPREDELHTLARRVLTKHPALESHPEMLLAEIVAYRKYQPARGQSTPHILLEKMLASDSLTQAASYWEVRGFLKYRRKSSHGIAGHTTDV